MTSKLTREFMQNIISGHGFGVAPSAVKAMAEYIVAAMDSEPVELPLDYLQGHKDGLEWAAQLAKANHPETGDWLYDDPIELAKAICKGPDIPPVHHEPVVDNEPIKYNIGDATMRHIFTPTGMTNVSDMQMVFDRVEVVLIELDCQPDPERDQVRTEHAEWSQSTFGNVGPIGPLKHLSKEALEAAAEPGDLSEWADMYFLLWDAQRRAGITDKQITQAMIEKLAVNKQRSWPEPKDGEPRLHIKEQPAPVVPPKQHWEELCRQHPDMSIRDAIIRAAWWNHCRAAMLNGGNDE